MWKWSLRCWLFCVLLRRINKKRKQNMRNFMKPLALCLLLSGFALGALAGESGVTFLFRNGTKASFAFSQKPCLAMTADGISVKANGESSAEFLFTDVQRYYFDDDIETAIKAVPAEDAEAQRPVFRYENNTMTVSGLKPGERLSAATVGGTIVQTVKADNQGNASIDMSATPSGMYVMATGSGVGCKIVKK